MSVSNAIPPYIPKPKGWGFTAFSDKVLPVEDLFCWETVHLTLDLAALISKPGLRVNCAICGEEIINQREIISGGRRICRACAGEVYYQRLSETVVSANGHS